MLMIFTFSRQILNFLRNIFVKIEANIKNEKVKYFKIFMKMMQPRIVNAFYRLWRACFWKIHEWATNISTNVLVQDFFYKNVSISTRNMTNLFQCKKKKNELKIFNKNTL